MFIQGLKNIGNAGIAFPRRQTFGRKEEPRKIDGKPKKLFSYSKIYTLTTLFDKIENPK